MIDYYSNLLRAVTSPGAGDAKWRRQVYSRARQMLAEQARKRQPPLTPRQANAERSALEAAIARVEAEVSWTDKHARAAPQSAGYAEAVVEPATEPAAQSYGIPLRSMPFRFGTSGWIGAIVVIAALGAAGALYFASRGRNAAPSPAQQAATAPAPTAPQTAPKPAPAPAPAQRAAATEKDGDLPPGVDGGNSDPDQPYVYRRQPTFYRTLQPVGTVIIDKLQHFLYLIQPNNVALRYGIGLGQACQDLVGVRHIATMAQWPSWEATPDMIKRHLANPGTMAGGPGNPLGARELDLDDNMTRIHGTNAPKTIGTTLAFGCIRLANDDITDLYGRVKTGTMVFVN